MKVKELIERLSRLNPEFEVVITDYNYGVTSPVTRIAVGRDDPSTADEFVETDTDQNAIELG